MIYVYVGLGGAIGSFLRFFVSHISLPHWNQFPLGTLIVNLLGSFILGWFAARMMPLHTISKELKTAFSTGVIGSFTTFSTLSVESVQLFEESHFGILFVYLFLSIFVGMLITAFGYFLGIRKAVSQ
ncbi:fluoride efflux transporter CrcB [Bacillus sp. CGMCC 1.16607]|uniref:fluoride efflux transporter CrcB n=1 Tax=Bacillus sp. CGMCC 1.16607 TaxID=3351842 RepID=UPI003645BFDF